jgi:hypothetical protein
MERSCSRPASETGETCSCVPCACKREKAGGGGGGREGGRESDWRDLLARAVRESFNGQVCMCVCVCARARACVRACVCKLETSPSHEVGNLWAYVGLVYTGFS